MQEGTAGKLAAAGNNPSPIGGLIGLHSGHKGKMHERPACIGCRAGDDGCTGAGRSLQFGSPTRHAFAEESLTRRAVHLAVEPVPVACRRIVVLVTGGIVSPPDGTSPAGTQFDSDSVTAFETQATVHNVPRIGISGGIDRSCATVTSAGRGIWRSRRGVVHQDERFGFPTDLDFVPDVIGVGLHEEIAHGPALIPMAVVAVGRL